MTDRSSTTPPNATPGKAPMFTNQYDHHLSAELEQALAYLKNHGTEELVERLEITDTTIHYNADGVPWLLTELLTSYVRAIALMSDEEAARLRDLPPAIGVEFARRVLSERGAR